MKISLILAHPRPGSFNHAIAEAVQGALVDDGHQVDFHDLHTEGFDPVLTAAELSARASSDDLLETHCLQIAGADGIVIIHPNWWGQPPAILKGWVDRVLRSGVAYRFDEGDDGEGVPIGLLRAHCALVINTTDTPRERELAAFGDPLDTLWKNCILHYCGVPRVERTVFGVVVTSTPQQRRQWLEEAAGCTRSCFPACAPR